jgi:hypothetical protein
VACSAVAEPLADPYRSSPADPWGAPAPLTAQPVFGRLVGAAIAAVSLGATSVGAPLVALGAFASGLALVAAAAITQRPRRLRRLRTLPFPVVHTGGLGDFEFGANPERICALRVDLVDELDDLHRELAVAHLRAAAPGLSLVAAGRVLTISGWSWLGQDLALLVELLDAWGRKLHAAHPIAAVHVDWLRVPPGAG